MQSSLALRAAALSAALFVTFVPGCHVRTQTTGAVQQMHPACAKLMGATATKGKSAMPGPFEVAVKIAEHLRRPFYDNGPNDKGIGIQLAYSIARVGVGYLLAVLVAVPIGFLIGMSPLRSRDMPMRNPIGTATS